MNAEVAESKGRAGSNRENSLGKEQINKQETEEERKSFSQSGSSHELLSVKIMLPSSPSSTCPSLFSSSSISSFSFSPSCSPSLLLSSPSISLSHIPYVSTPTPTVADTATAVASFNVVTVAAAAAAIHPFIRNYLASHSTNVSVISLLRRSDRWLPAENNIKQALACFIEKCSNIQVEMFAGVDAHAHKVLLPDLSAIEEQLGAKVYRGWAITETCDVLRALHLREDTPEVQAWIEYENLYLRNWQRSYGSRYIDYFNRHMTLGECGSTLSHLSVIEKAHRDNVSVQVIFEDDARPHSFTVPLLMHQILQLENQGIEWDLIYLRSSKYSLAEEISVPGTILTRAGHRKCVDAYAVSKAGATKIAQCGFRDSLFPIDDFIPALHSFYPRADIRSLPCVRVITDNGGLAAFAFPTFVPASFEPELCAQLGIKNLETLTICDLMQTDSDNNKSPCVIGDHGVETCCE